MNNVLTPKAFTVTAADPEISAIPPDLDAMLRYSESFGQLYVCRSGQGWLAWIKMNTNVTGAEFKIQTDTIDGRSPSDTVKDLLFRMHAALKTLGAKP